MFERFTERARQVIVLAQDEARSLKHSYIGTEHVLAGLLREEEGLAARVLKSYLSADQVRDDIVRIIGHGERYVTGQIPFTPRAKKVLELALREALSLGHNYIGTEHILLALTRDDEGNAKRILLDNWLEAEDIRNDVIAMLSGPGERQSTRQERQEKQRKTEAETSKESSQENSESNPEKVRATITYGGLTLTIEGDTSGLSSTQINNLLGFASKIFKK